jgi:hypothetical protein
MQSCLVDVSGRKSFRENPAEVPGKVEQAKQDGVSQQQHIRDAAENEGDQEAADPVADIQAVADVTGTPIGIDPCQLSLPAVDATGVHAGVVASGEQIAINLTGGQESANSAAEEAVGAAEEAAHDVTEGNDDINADGEETALDVTEIVDEKGTAGSLEGAEQGRAVEESADDTGETRAAPASGEGILRPSLSIDTAGGAAGGAHASEAPEEAAKGPLAAESGEEVLRLAASDVSADTGAQPTLAAEAVEEKSRPKASAATESARDGLSVVASGDTAARALKPEDVLLAASAVHADPGAAGIAPAIMAVATAVGSAGGLNTTEVARAPHAVHPVPSAGDGPHAATAAVNGGPTAVERTQSSEAASALVSGTAPPEKQATTAGGAPLDFGPLAAPPVHGGDVTPSPELPGGDMLDYRTILAEMGRLKTQVDQLQENDSKQRGLEKKVQGLEKKVEGLQKKVGEQEREIGTLKSANTGLRSEIASLFVHAADALQQTQN